MKTLNLKVKNYVGNANVVNNTDLNKKIFNFFLISFGALALVYILLLGNMVMNIVERKSLEKESRVLSSEVGDLELNYLSLYKTIDVNLSYTMGYKEVKPNFAKRSPLVTLKLAKNEI